MGLYARRVSFSGFGELTRGLLNSDDVNTTIFSPYSITTFGFVYGLGDIWYNQDQDIIQEVTWTDCECIVECS